MKIILSEFQTTKSALFPKLLALRELLKTAVIFLDGLFCMVELKLFAKFPENYCPYSTTFALFLYLF